MSLIDNDFYLYEVAEEELPNQVDDKYEDDEDDSFSASYSYKDGSEDSWDEEGCEEGYFLYGKLNKEVEKRTYTGTSTETADTLVDDFNSTISVNVKQSPKDLSKAYIDKKTNEIVFIARDGSEISRTPYVPEALIQHLVDYDNPHRTTAEQVGAVPVDFRSFSAAPTTTKNFRQSAELFVGNNGNGFRMTLQDVKNMGTKIVTVNDIQEADFDNLDVGDYIYSNI